MEKELCSYCFLHSHHEALSSPEHPFWANAHGVCIPNRTVSDQCHLGHTGGLYESPYNLPAAMRALRNPIFFPEGTVFATTSMTIDCVAAMAVASLRIAGMEDCINTLLLEQLGKLESQGWRKSKGIFGPHEGFHKLCCHAIKSIVFGSGPASKSLSTQVQQVAQIISSEMKPEEVERVVTSSTVADRLGIYRYGPTPIIFAPREMRFARKIAMSSMPFAVILDPLYTHDFWQPHESQVRWTITWQEGRIDGPGLEAALNAFEARGRNISVSDLRANLRWSAKDWKVSSPEGPDVRSYISLPNIVSTVLYHTRVQRGGKLMAA